MSEGLVYYQNKRIHFEDDGAGDVIILLNGIMMSTRSWNPFVSVLSSTFRLIRIDFLDQGQSDKAPDLPYNQYSQAEVVIAVMDYLHINKAHLVGISYGGEVAILCALLYSNRFSRLILFNTTAYTSVWLKHIGKSWIATGKTRDGNAYYHTTIPVIYSQRFYEKEIMWMDQRKEKLIPLFSNQEFLDAIERLTLSAESYDVRDRLHGISSKTLIVAAEEDTLTPKSDQELLHSLIEGSDLISIPLCGHASMYEKPLLFASLIIGYLSVKETNFVI